MNLLLAILLGSMFACTEDIIDPYLPIDQEHDPSIYGDFYVALWGDDSNPGTADLPFATLQHAIYYAKPGDTVYIRGGTYYPPKTISISPLRGKGEDGEADNYIHYFNYPGETPVFDFKNFDPPGNYATGLLLSRASFIHLRGLTIRNVQQKKDGVEVLGVYLYEGSNIIHERLTVHDCGGNAFRYAGALGYYGIDYDSSYYINCDAYNCVDARPREPGATLGGAADGFKSWNEPGAYLHFEGCRAWNNSDDGFDPGTDPVTVINGCWSFRNGSLDGDGTGFKTGGMHHDNGDLVTRWVTNNIAAENTHSGFFLLEYEDYKRTNARIYNNLFYKNGGAPFFSRNAMYPETLSVWKNNISYAHEGSAFGNAYQKYTESHNSWDLVPGYPGWINTDSVNLNAKDFRSLDVDELDNPRKEDGSLPDVDFGRLVPGSDLEEAGTHVGMSENPDMGIDWNYMDSRSFKK